MSRLVLWILVALLVGGSFWAGFAIKTEDLPLPKNISFDHVLNFLSETKENKPETVSSSFKKEVSAPGPLTGLLEAVSVDLVSEHVLSETNQRRAQEGLPLLSSNVLLIRAAGDKTEDMFARQYFEHVSPLGVDIADLMENVGYDYITVGENLAMGNYKDEEALVTAWMESPPHRDNILNPKFTQIGISVKKGIYEGREVWMAVQEFGKPLSACPQTDQALYNLIEENKRMLSSLEKKLAIQKSVIDALTPKHGAEFSEAVAVYNALVSEYNTLSDSTKSKVSEYNAQVKAFNVCVGL